MAGYDARWLGDISKHLHHLLHVPLLNSYSLEPGDWDTGLGCVVRSASTTLGRDDLEVTRVHAASIALPLHDSEELISNIVRLAPCLPDGGLPNVSARMTIVNLVVVVVVCLLHNSEKLISSILRRAPRHLVKVIVVVVGGVMVVVMCLLHRISNIVLLAPCHQDGGLPYVSARMVRFVIRTAIFLTLVPE